MINLRRAGVLFLWLVSINFSAYADDGTTANTETNNTTDAESASGDQTSQYLKTLGAFLGYDLTTDSSSIPIYDDLLSYTASLTQHGNQVLQAYLSAIPVNNSFLSFTTNTSYDNFLNPMANILFTNSYTKTDGTSPISVTCNFDQQTYQGDPVSQSVLNLLGTPDWSLCPTTSSSSTSSSSSTGECQPLSCLSQDQVMHTVLQDTNNGTIPSENDYYTYATNAHFISQLNSDNLLSPLLYSTSSNSTSTSTGLPSQTQAQQAQEFIRYATEAVTPIPTLSKDDFAALYAIANTATTDSNGNPITTVDANNVKNAKTALQNYLLNFRVYAAKNSVVTNNLYYLLSKRMPLTVKNANGDNTTTSEALNDFVMATWRIYNPTQSEQWSTQINQASPATVFKEIAILLSDINYRLYKISVDQNRLILTDSILLSSVLAVNKPNPSFPSNVDRETTPPEG